MPLYHMLQRSAARCPERLAMIELDEGTGEELSSVSYAELDRQSTSLANSLVSLRVEKGDRVAYFLQNSPWLVTSFYGILKAGAVAVPCNPMYQADELAYQLQDSGARAIICAPQLYPLVEQVRTRTSLEQVIVAGDGSAGSASLLLADLAHRPGKPVPLPAVEPADDLALLPYTGGTTGVPKGAMLTHLNLVTNATQFARWFDYQQGAEVFIAALPLFHIGGIAGVMSVPLSVGGTILLMRRFQPRTVLETIQHYCVTRFLGVPTTYIALLNHQGASSYDLSSLRPSRTSAAPLPPTVKEAFDKLVGHEVLIEGYGLTEASPLTHVNPPLAARAGSIGLPLPDTEACIVDPDDESRLLPPGQVGELVLRGPQVMRGYWNRPEETAHASRGGWFHTGDLARMDEDGYFYVVDRQKDVINAAGFKVWPREVEEILYRHPMVKLAAVVAATDDYRGETVRACIVLKESLGVSPDATRDEIIAFCRRELAAYKVPRIVDIVESLPVSAAGKVLRRALRDSGVPGTH